MDKDTEKYFNSLGDRVKQIDSPELQAKGEAMAEAQTQEMLALEKEFQQDLQLIITNYQKKVRNLKLPGFLTIGRAAKCLLEACQAINHQVCGEAEMIVLDRDITRMEMKTRGH